MVAPAIPFVIIGFLAAGSLLVALQNNRGRQGLSFPKRGGGQGSFSPLSSQSIIIGLRILESVLLKTSTGTLPNPAQKEYPAEPVVMGAQDLIPSPYPIDADISGIIGPDGKPVTESWIKQFDLSNATTSTILRLDDMRRRNPKCDCKAKGSVDTTKQYMSAWAAMFQWTVAAVLDLHNFRTNKYKLYIGHEETEKARNENPLLPRMSLSSVFDLAKYNLNSLNGQRRHVQISEFKCQNVSFDGYWPSYCTFVETKYGYGKTDKDSDKQNDYRASWPGQLNRQIKAIKAADAQTPCPLESPLVWVFSNGNAKEHFDKIMKTSKRRKNTLEPYKNIFSISLSAKELKVLRHQ